VDVIPKFLQRAACCAMLTAVVLGGSVISHAQTSGGSHSVSIGSDIKHMPANLVHDQFRIWTSPARLKLKDATWLVPVGGLAAGMIASDRDFSRTVAKHTSIQSPANTLSNAGLFALAGGAGGLYLWGAASGDPHKRETGLLSSEALVDSLGVVEVLKYAFHRDRPNQNLDGHFFRSGTSFPSGHAILSFSAATVIANEYPGWATQTLAYGAATAVSMARVAALQHFPSDVFVGGTLGYLIGRSVYRNHHDQDLPGAEWGTFESDKDADTDAYTASSFVPIDSWVYPVLDRLIAAGYIKSNISGMRPWTRRECARLVEEAQNQIEGDTGDVGVMLSDLQAEFAAELGHEMQPSAQIESLYFRSTSISGPPLTDGFHFGQTITDDYGRPYGEGWNGVGGVTAYANAGPLVFYVRGEAERGAGTPGISRPVADQIGAFDFIPAGVYPTGGTPETLRVRMLEGYVGYGFHDWQITAGTQSLWWGPTQDAPMLFSNNAEPIPMVRVSRTSPMSMPSFLHWMGPVRAEFLVGRLTGQRFIDNGSGGFFGPDLPKQPFIVGQKLSFKPTENLELGIAETAVFGGPGQAFTAANLGRALFTASSATILTGSDASDRRSGVNFSYRIPKLRQWLTFYNDAFADDWISPLANPRRSAMHPGIYLPKLPKLHHLDLRVEAAYTDIPSVRDVGFFYFNARFNSGYTNGGNIIGNPVGREGRTILSWSTYWFSPRRSVQVGYRNAAVDPEFLGGGRINDISGRADFALNKEVSMQALVQHENWNFPLLAPQTKTNDTVSLQLTFRPSNWRTR
jgi:membrane-associated phospholipid phosphatase